MDFKEVMTQLEEAGTAQARKIYARHGMKEPMFGVSYKTFRALAKKIKKDSDLARKLWATGNGDAMTLACQIFDPADVTMKEVDLWIKAVNYYMIAGEVAQLISESPLAKEVSKTWRDSPKEYVKEAGYSIVSRRLSHDAEAFSEKELSAILATIEKEIHDSPNRARMAMNSALIAIGGYVPSLTKKALEVADRIGKVEVDHGETSCKTPDARPYIEKMIARKR